MEEKKKEGRRERTRLYIVRQDFVRRKEQQLDDIGWFSESDDGGEC